MFVLSGVNEGFWQVEHPAKRVKDLGVSHLKKAVGIGGNAVDKKLITIRNVPI
jgi:hypothetical protein